VALAEDVVIGCDAIGRPSVRSNRSHCDENSMGGACGLVLALRKGHDQCHKAVRRFRLWRQFSDHPVKELVEC